MPQIRGYLLGHLFAHLASQGVLEKPPERLYQPASTAPPQVLPKALATLIAEGKEDTIFPLMKHLPLDTFDGGLNRREQGVFALGYAHERSGYTTSVLDEEQDEEEQESLLSLSHLLVHPAIPIGTRTLLRSCVGVIHQAPTSKNMICRKETHG